MWQKTHPHVTVFFISYAGNPRSSTLFPYTTLFRSSMPRPLRWGYPATRLKSWACRHMVWRRSVGAKSEEHTSELQSHVNLVCRLLLEKKNTFHQSTHPLHQYFSFFQHRFHLLLQVC